MELPVLAFPVRRHPPDPLAGVAEVTNGEAGNRGFAERSGRAAKAEKILAVLTECQAESGRLLDIGTGSGEIASHLGTRFETFSVDIVDQRTCRHGYRFLQTAERLPFADASFDVVVSNHVIEHVRDQALHLSEIHRVLKPGGLVYLAPPNRLWPWEVHYRVPLLHWLPVAWFHAWLRWRGRFREEIHLLTFLSLLRMGRRFDIHWVGDRICRQPRRYGMNVPPALDRILARLPEILFRLARPLHPTFVVVLRKRR